MRYAPHRPLPEAAYIPGRDPRPATTDEPAAPARLPHEFMLSDHYLWGIDLYNGGFAWEAHESWEAQWQQTETGPHKQLLQGLIQCAAAAVKVEQHNAAGLRSVSERALAHLDAAESPSMGLDVDSFAERFGQWVAGEPDDLSAMPRIELRLRSRDLPGTLTDGYVSAAPVHLDRDRYRVRRTPSRPDFYFGQALIPDEAPALDQVEVCFSRFRHELAGVEYQRQLVTWETMSPDAWPGAAELGGSTSYEQTHVMRADTWPAQPPRPEGIDIRSLASDTDWEAAIALSLELETEIPLAAFEPFVRWRYGKYRTAVEPRGAGAFWGAFDGEKLAGSLGLVTSPSWLRFCDVRTAGAYRRRGICASLVSWALREGLAAHPGAVAIIGVVPDSIASRIYARAGFRVIGSQHTLSRAA